MTNPPDRGENIQRTPSPKRTTIPPRIAARQKRRTRNRQFLVGLAVVLVVLVGMHFASQRSKKVVSIPLVHTSPRATASPATITYDAAESGELPWSLPYPGSRFTVLPSATGNLTIAGGLTSSGTSSGEIFSLNPATSTLTRIGTLPTATHDASGAIVNGNAFIFGGGQGSVSSANVQAFPDSASAGTAIEKGTLPTVLSDSEAVTIGNTAYIIGGYSGKTGNASIFATTDGVHFLTVAHLSISVRYPAVAVLSNEVYIFGGEATSGPSSGSATSSIQLFDPHTKTVRIVGSLPIPLEGASAGALGNTIYIAGGETKASSGAVNSNAIFALDPSTKTLLNAGSLQVPVAYAGSAVLNGKLWIIGGENSSGTTLSTVQMVEPNASFGTAGTPGAGSPFYHNQLLVADQENGRLVLMNDTNTITWQFPSSTTSSYPGFSADDAFFAKNGTVIVTNQEYTDVVSTISYPAGKVLWSYGHLNRPGSSVGYLNTPDDAYLLKNGDIITADIQNCRILILNPTTNAVVSQIGKSGVCRHNLTGQITLGSPNGDTPLSNGNILVSEIDGSYIDEFTPQGALVWSVHLPISYPSDPQQIGPNEYLVADYSSPGGIIEFNQQGQVLYRYQPSSGQGMLNHPSLVEVLPNGVFMLNDDGNDRMIAIDPATGARVWQYGVTGVPGRAIGYLDDPDGFDFLVNGTQTPTHPSTG